MNSPHETGTTPGTTVQPFHWNDKWNAERRFASTGAAYRWNDTWNDARITHPERSTHSLKSGTVERGAADGEVQVRVADDIGARPRRLRLVASTIGDQ